MVGFNKVLIAGRVVDHSVQLSYGADGSPQTRLTRMIEEGAPDGKRFQLFIAVECFSKHSEWAAERLSDGDICIVDGKLKFRRGDKPGLVVLAWQVTPISPRTPATVSPH